MTTTTTAATNNNNNLLGKEVSFECGMERVYGVVVGTLGEYLLIFRGGNQGFSEEGLRDFFPSLCEEGLFIHERYRVDNIYFDLAKREEVIVV